MTNRMLMCCALLAGTAMLTPNKAKASTDDDKNFLAMAAQSDQNEIALSQAASEKASKPSVKSYATKMVSDHMAMTATMKPFADKWGVTPPSGPDADHKAELDKLNGLSGADFDKEYMTQMAADHAKALDAFTNEVQTTQDAKFKAVVTRGKAKVAAHKTMADSMEKKMDTMAKM